jgi:hypothetical protein
MRETRSSGSVEGVMGNHDSYSDCLSPGALCGADQENQQESTSSDNGARKCSCWYDVWELVVPLVLGDGRLQP